VLLRGRLDLAWGSTAAAWSVIRRLLNWPRSHARGSEEWWRRVLVRLPSTARRHLAGSRVVSPIGVR
jgi:hypothetical protein